MNATLAIVIYGGVLLGLSGCGESASTYDHKSGRYISTDDYKDKFHVNSVCQRASCWDNKSGRFIGADEWNHRQREMDVQPGGDVSCKTCLLDACSSSC